MTINCLWKCYCIPTDCPVQIVTAAVARHPQKKANQCKGHGKNGMRKLNEAEIVFYLLQNDDLISINLWLVLVDAVADELPQYHPSGRSNIQ